MKIFIFRSLNVHVNLAKVISVVSLVLKEIESPDGMELYADFGKSNLAYNFNSVRAFCFYRLAKYTSILRVVGTGIFSFSNIITVMFKTSDRKPRHCTFSETTNSQQVSNCRFSLPMFSERGIIGGEDLHYLSLPLAHSE